jgi:hypothetical protein
MWLELVEFAGTSDVSGNDLLVAFNAMLNTLQVCFLGYLAAKYQRPPAAAQAGAEGP